MDENELKWKRFTLDIDLYKSYLELLIKFNVFYYAITGAILSYYFAHQDIKVLACSLILPLILSLGFGVFFLYAAKLVTVMRADIILTAQELKLRTYPEVQVLKFLLILFGSIFIVISIGLIYLIIARIFF